MAIAAGISAHEERWVRFEEVLQRQGIGGLQPATSDGEGWVNFAPLCQAWAKLFRSGAGCSALHIGNLINISTKD